MSRAIFKTAKFYLFCLGFVFMLSSTPAAFAAGQEDGIVFAVGNIQVGTHKVHVEIADTNEKRAMGLMFRRKLKPNHGMLFLFEAEQQLSFWMKNTLIPLSIGYFDKNGKLVDIKEMQPISLVDKAPQVYPSKEPAQYALEMEKGWFDKNKIKLGSHLSLLFSHPLGPKSQKAHK